MEKLAGLPPNALSNMIAKNPNLGKLFFGL
jgi:hypothetical protein